MKQEKAYSKVSDDSTYLDYINETEPLRNSAWADRTFLGTDTNISVRSEFLRSDFDHYRSGSITPDKPYDIMKTAMKIYSKVGIVRNVIDIMSDFAVQGIRLQHSNPTVERFYNKWFSKVKGKDRSERFLNYLYRVGNVVVNRVDAKIPTSKIKQWKAVGENFLEDPVIKREIPLRYYFLNPLTVDVLGKELSTFTGKSVYYLKLNTRLKADIAEMERNNQPVDLPAEIVNAIKSKNNKYILPSNKLYVAHYKKDDWQVWAEPMTYGIVDDLVAYEKMRLADLAALDGAISNIRLWTLGYIDTVNPGNSLIPSKSVLNKVRDILHNNSGGGPMDLVWGPDLTFKESNSQVYKFLGSAKYENTLNAIYDGMGVPSVLRSGSKGAGGSASFIALKTLVERLEYGRSVLLDFWNEQIKLVQKAMGFDSPAQVIFDKLILSDESTELDLLMKLADRDLISSESLLEKFDLLPNIEKSRIQRELKKRGKSLPEKASPFHNPLWQAKIKENLLMGGSIEPEEIGLKFKNFKPVQPVGRPNNVVETQKRKPKPIGKPQTGKADLSIAYTWTNEVYKQVVDVISPAILHAFDKKNFRQLTTEESSKAEYIKFSVLFGFDLFEEINNDKIMAFLEKDTVTKDAKELFDFLYKSFALKFERKPNMDELRQIYINTYVIEKGNNGQD